MKRKLTQLASLRFSSFCISKDLFTNTDRFFAFIQYNYDYVDVMTYTFGRNPLTNVRRVVFNILCDEEAPQHVVELRTNTNIHSKAFLCFIDKRLVDVYAGSLNLRYGLNYNMMFRLSTRMHRPVKDYFKMLWDASKKFPTNGNADNVYVKQQKQNKQNIWQSVNSAKHREC